MKKGFIKPLALAMSAVMLVGGSVGATVYAMGDRVQRDAPVISDAAIKSGGRAETLTKDETVYVLAGAEGTVRKIIVSDWIKNAIGAAEITDKSELTNVENVKGNESYTMGGEHTRVWDAQGNDIYYQGNVEKELPVSLSVSYLLDGSPISAAELAGKSGRVTIRFDYKNNQYEMVSIDGKAEKIYVPFAMLTGALLDGDVFRNVEVSNGKIINDGSRTVVIGVALPGLQENLALDAEKFTIPDYVEITADVTKFEMGNTVTIATNELFNKIDTEKLNSVDDLTASFDDLTDAMTKLTDGSSKLYDGLCTLLEKSGELVEGIDALADGALKLKKGAGSLASGAVDLANGASSLASGLRTLDANSAELSAGAGQVFESLLSMADTQLAAAGLSVPKLTISNYATVLGQVIASLDPNHVAEQAQAVAREKVTAAVNANRDAVVSAVTAAVQEEVTANVTAAVRATVETEVLGAMGMTKEEYEAGIAAGAVSEEIQAQVAAAIETQMQSEAVQAQITAAVTAQMQSDEIGALVASQTEAQIALLIEQNMASPEVQAQITAALEQAKSGAASISALKGQLDSYNTFYTGVKQYTAGVSAAKKGADQLNAGAGRLKSGANDLASGANTLYNGILTLKDGAPALIDGVTALRDGAMKLSDGLVEFDEKGVQKLIDAVDGNIGGLITRVKATVDVSEDYRSFSGLSEEMDGQVKFIYRTDAIEAK